MNKYIILHGNVIYKVENVTYKNTTTHRVFMKNNSIVLSVPLSSVLIKDGEGVTAQITNNLITGAGFNAQNKKTTVKQSEDNFAEGVVVGGIVGATLF